MTRSDRSLIWKTIRRWRKIATADDPRKEYERTPCAPCHKTDEHSGRCRDCPVGVACAVAWQRWNVVSWELVHGEASEAAWYVHDWCVRLLVGA